jgi:hypothetical protein
VSSEVVLAVVVGAAREPHPPVPVDHHGGAKAGVRLKRLSEGKLGSGHPRVG